MSDKNLLQPRPGNDERAWNDPPLFSYRTTVTPSVTGTKLNKRVGFPPSTATTTQMTAPVASNSSNNRNYGIPLSCKPPATSCLPPPPLSSSVGVEPLLPINEPSVVCVDEPIPTEATTDVQNVVTNLNVVLDEVSDKIDKKKFQDVTKRIGIMSSKWDTFNTQVQVNMCKLSKALRDGRLEEAGEIQRTLMVDWPALCGTWMVGIKHLVQETSRLHLLTLSRSQDSADYDRNILMEKPPEDDIE